MSDNNRTSNQCGCIGLRFAALVRVSTEKQEKQGESLSTQRDSIARDVAPLGTIAGWYGGQEHATPTWEKKEVDRLIRDAQKGLFNAVIVAYADRWSRDNKKSKEGLEIFRQHGIRFFIGTAEQNLFDPTVRLALGLHAEIGEFLALNSSKKALETRVARAKRGIPVSGKLPYGRTFNKSKGEWGIDPKKQALVEEAARRYLAGESLLGLADEFGMSGSYLHHIVMRRSGTEWEQTFQSKALNFSEKVITTVPPLLDDKTIRALHEQAQANKTYKHGHIIHRYMLSRMVFCGYCGSSLSGHYDSKGMPRRYYIHPKPRRRKKECPEPSALVRADDLEEAVMSDLFSLFGNPALVVAAVAAATPDGEEVETCRRRQGEVMGLLAEVKVKKSNVVKAIANGTISDEEARGDMETFRKREGSLQRELSALEARLENQPDPEETRRLAEEAARRQAGCTLESLSWEDKRALAQLAFAGSCDGPPRLTIGHGSPPVEGERRGIYVRRMPGRKRGCRQYWHYQLRGRITLDFWGSTGTREDVVLHSSTTKSSSS
jgi:DNA invertase Pin-like site-specific DNA recombinase